MGLFFPPLLRIPVPTGSLLGRSGSKLRQNEMRNYKPAGKTGVKAKCSAVGDCVVAHWICELGSVDLIEAFGKARFVLWACPT